MPDWKSLDVVERLVAALVASNGGKVDVMATARYFNDSYDAVEKRFRIYKKAAQALTEEAEADGRLEANMRNKNAITKKTATPKKGAAGTPDSVRSGRVAKRAPKTPSKIKRYPSTDEDEEMGVTAGGAEVKAGPEEEEV